MSLSSECAQVPGFNHGSKTRQAHTSMSNCLPWWVVSMSKTRRCPRRCRLSKTLPKMLSNVENGIIDVVCRRCRGCRRRCRRRCRRHCRRRCRRHCCRRSRRCCRKRSQRRCRLSKILLKTLPETLSRTPRPKTLSNTLRPKTLSKTLQPKTLSKTLRPKTLSSRREQNGNVVKLDTLSRRRAVAQVCSSTHDTSFISSLPPYEFGSASSNSNPGVSKWSTHVLRYRLIISVVFLVSFGYLVQERSHCILVEVSETIMRSLTQ